MQLELIQEKLEILRIDIENHFKAINTPDNVIIKKDPFYGKRTIHFNLRLDEFSIEKLKEFTPKLEKLMNIYNDLRSKESAIADKILIEKARNPENFLSPKY